MRISLNSVIVKDQESALQFYTGILGFETKIDLPVGEYRWLTVVSAEDPDGTQLLLEPDALPAAQTFQKALYEGGIPLTSFEVDDVEAEYKRLTALGVAFTAGPTLAGDAVIAVFDDTCGNLIQIYQS